MKAIILAAGYATRLYPLTLNTPKPLLEINNKFIIDYITEEIETIDEIDEIFIVTNNKFYINFETWNNNRKSLKSITVINDGTSSDETKLGAIGDINLVINQKNINDDVIIIAGDNLFTYKLKDGLDFYKNVNKDVIFVKQLDDLEELRRVGIVLLDDNSKVLDFEEKPFNPKSNNAVFATYIYKKETLPLFKEYLSLGNSPDAPGNFPAWLYKQKDVIAYKFNGECYDIGTHKSLNEVRELFKN